MALSTLKPPSGKRGQMKKNEFRKMLYEEVKDFANTQYASEGDTANLWGFMRHLEMKLGDEL
jgi:hypothetical protein